MSFAVPGVKGVEDYSKVIDSSAVTDKDVLVNLTLNYVKAVNINLLRSRDRSHHFHEVRMLMFCGIVFTVICIGLFGIIKLMIIIQ